MSLKVKLLEDSFDRIKPKARAFSASFYHNLFEMYPVAKPLFANTDMIAQREKLIKSLVLVTSNLRSPDVLTETLAGLGSRHVEYGALPEHYPLVGNALLATFEEYLGTAWTEEVKQAWVEAYAAITELMLEGADYGQEEVSLESAVPEPTPISSENQIAYEAPIAASYGSSKPPKPKTNKYNQETKASDVNWPVVGGLLGVGGILIVVIWLSNT
ncbi:globin [Thalassoporum mexicanum PCC 7367]|uniref:globin family protein n=1 Tax=Thalassoporum mexicanum TaxID=3457544 RepID=UPI00029FF8EE|nr:globin family protein [Pseudanabaena sp. PCC 7367]AFY69602.1 globin [Pseudanabaena sp. PCC 7367]